MVLPVANTIISHHCYSLTDQVISNESIVNLVVLLAALRGLPVTILFQS